ncbi:putative pterin-4-alpha-carbinolamine dehydratase, chloroplastic [Silene latifolia]|uniref:putative pterin-4-alpha-carbinolamine dehydratase, chloroplastic n=1 Tax=Silene latifolia TaxID=37657 RepID=UPI003D77C4A6
MATSSISSFCCYTPSSFTTSPSSTTRTRNVTCNPRTCSLPIIRACKPDIIGDFGARDPFPAELESQFCEKVLGNMSTEHKILIPQASVLSLSQHSCIPISSDTTPLTQYEAKQLLHKVLGWRVAEDKDKVFKLYCLWKVKDFDSGVELINRISNVGQTAGHSPVLHHLEETNQVRAELWTPQIGGLSINDFIVAAKIDDINTSDLVPRKRVWA